MPYKYKRRLNIAIDFDGTITESNSYPRIGKLRPYAKQVINKLRDLGNYIYLWTCRTGATLEDAKAFLAVNGIELDGYNEGPSTGSPKLIADVYIDDMAYPNNGEIDWVAIAKSFDIDIEDLENGDNQDEV